MLSFLKNCASAILGRSWGLHSILKPVVVHLTLTDKCNLRCRMCNIWQKKDKRDVPLKTVRQIASSKYGKNVKVLDITGGEPFLSEIEEAVNIFDQNHLRLVLVSTNGVMTKRIIETTERLLSRGKYSLHLSISVDGEQEYHDDVRGVKGTFDKLENTLYELKKLQTKTKRLRVGIKMTVMPDNIDRIVPLYKYANRLGLDFTAKPAAVFEFLDNPGMDFSFSQQQTSDLSGAFKIIIADEKKKQLSGRSFWERLYHASNILFHETLIDYMGKCAKGKPNKPPAPCLSSFLSIMVHSDGKAYSCPTLMKEIGDIAEQGFDGIWRSNRMEKIRRFIRQGKCSCFSQCDQMPSLLMNNKLRLTWLLLRSYYPLTMRRKKCLVFGS